jgi:hypothetical protein
VKGLREVHANKLLHLDLKPANIYLRTDGTPMLLDFGAARQTINTDMPTLTPMYTPGFAPPELYAKTGMGPWTDIYSIGASMFACMVGSPPQPADQRKLEDKMAGHFEKLEGQYSPELVQLVRWCLQIDPLDRPQSLFALQKVLAAKPPVAAPPTAAQSMLDKLRGLVGRGRRQRRRARAPRPVRIRWSDAATLQGPHAILRVPGKSYRRPQGQSGPHGLQLHARRAAAGAGRRHGRASARRDRRQRGAATISTLFQQQAQPYVKKPQRFLEEALQAAHRDIHQYRHAHKLPETPRTTIVACLIQHNTATWAHCGDSRLYWMRNGQILGRTRDHSHVENLIAKGMALPSERATHPDRNKLWNCLGADSLPRVEVGAGAGCCRAIWCCCVPTVCGLCCRTMKSCAACRRKPWCARCRTCCKPRCVQRATPATTSRRWPSCGRAVRCWIIWTR